MNTFKFDFGPVNNNTVRMSMYGLAVRNKTGSFVSYNADSNEIIDVNVFNFNGSNFLYKMPVAIKDVAVGDVVVHQNAPMFVEKIPEDGKTLLVIDVVSGEKKEIMLTRSPFGFNFATKIVNFLGNIFNNASVSEDSPFGNLWMLLAMSNNCDDDDDDKNFDPNMLMFMMMSNNCENNNLLPMMMMMNMNKKS